jgi:hypothetical protein
MPKNKCLKTKMWRIEEAKELSNLKKTPKRGLNLGKENLGLLLIRPKWAPRLSIKKRFSSLTNK